MEVWELREGFGLEHLRKPDPVPGPGEVLQFSQQRTPPPINGPLH